MNWQGYMTNITMFNILYYDIEKYDMDEIQDIVAALKKGLPASMRDNTVIIPKDFEFRQYLEPSEIEYLLLKEKHRKEFTGL